MGILDLLRLPGPSSHVSQTPSACVACAGTELYKQPDFRRSIGLWTVGIASVATVPFMVMGFDWWIIWSPMFVALVLDRFFARKSEDVLICYRCDHIHRGLTREQASGFEPFDLETHDRHRYKEMEAASKQNPRV
jgi:hypothetical protein